MKFRVDEITSVIKQEIVRYKGEIDVSEVGRVLEVGDGIAQVYGLTNAMAGEMLEFENGAVGQVFNLEENTIGVAVLGEYLSIREGDTVRGTGELLSVPVGDALIGRVVDPLGRPLDNQGVVDSPHRRPLESTVSKATGTFWDAADTMRGIKKAGKSSVIITQAIFARAARRPLPFPCSGSV